MDRARILVLDDDAPFASELARRLEARGIDVDVASGAESAFKALLRQRPDLIVISDRVCGASQVQRQATLARVPTILRVQGPSAVNTSGAMLSAAACLRANQTPGEAADTIVDLINRADAGELPSTQPAKLRVLVVEDEVLHCALIRRSLETIGAPPICLTFARSVAEACELLADQTFDCVIVDHHLPDGHGLDLLQQAQERLLTVPVIGLSGGEDAAVALDYFREGCIDFYFKTEALSADRLRQGIAHALARFHRRALATLISRQQLGSSVMNSQEGLIALARSDRLMSICNRASFDDFLPNFHREMEMQGRTYALCLADVDHFKGYNDDHGHMAGDDVLREVAQSLASTLRGRDFIARYGGEEIVIVLEAINAEDLPAVADRLRMRVFELNRKHRRNPPHGRVTVSIGAALFEPGNGVSPDQLLVQADQALYEAKSRGRNCVAIFGQAQQRMTG